MIGERYWATGIEVDHHPDDRKWSARVDYYDGGFVGDDDPDAGRIVTEGHLHTRYSIRDGATVDALTAVIDAIKADAERLGIEWRGEPTGPHVFVAFEAAVENYPERYPAGWRELVDGHAGRLGWAPLYTVRHRV